MRRPSAWSNRVLKTMRKAFTAEAATPGGIHALDWESVRGDNTQDIRRKRMRRLLQALLSLGYLDRDLHARLTANRPHTVFLMVEQFERDRRRRACESAP